MGRRVNVARSRPQPGPAQGHRPGAARGGPAVRARVVGVPRHPRLDRRRRPARPGPARAAGRIEIRPARVAPRPAGRDRPARGRRPVRRRHRGRRHPVLRPPRPGRRRRRRLDPAGGPRPPAGRHRGGRLLRRPARGGPRPRPDRPDRRGPRCPRRPISSTARSTPSSAPSGSSPRARPSDAEFLRRVTLDVIGTLPTPGGGPRLPRRRVAATSARGRSTRLLAHPMHAALWATRFLDITGCDVDAMEGPDGAPAPPGPDVARLVPQRGSPTNMPYDRIARGVLCATSRDGEDARALGSARGRADCARPGTGGETDYADRPGLDLFWRRLSTASTSPVEQMAERTADGVPGRPASNAPSATSTRSTAGPRPTTARSPTSSPTSSSASRPTASPRPPRLLDERRKADPSGALPPIPRLREVYVADRPARRLADPDTGRPLPPRALGGPELPDDGDPRERLFAWLTRARQPVLRPQLRQPRLGRLLRRRPGRSGRRLLGRQPAVERPAARRPGGRLRRPRLRHPPAGADDPRTRGPTSAPRTPVAGNLDDRGNFARSMPQALDGRGPGRRAQRRARRARATSAPTPRREPGHRGRHQPGRRRPTWPGPSASSAGPGGPSTCDCERPKTPALPQTLFLMTDAALLAKLKAGRLRALARVGPLRRRGVEELFLATLSRPPSADEARSALDHLRTEPDRAAGLADVLWALINTREFVLNH